MIVYHKGCLPDGYSFLTPKPDTLMPNCSNRPVRQLALLCHCSRNPPSHGLRLISGLRDPQAEVGRRRLSAVPRLRPASRSPFFFWCAPYATVHADNPATQMKGVTFELAKAVLVDVP